MDHTLELMKGASNPAHLQPGISMTILTSIPSKDTSIQCFRQIRKGFFPPVSVADRVTIRIFYTDGTGFSNACVSVLTDLSSSPIIESFAGTDGIFRFFPTIDGVNDATEFTLQIRPPNSDTPSVDVTSNLDELDAERTLDVTLADEVSSIPELLDLMLDQLAEQNAGRGGNYPEAVEQDLAEAMIAEWPCGNSARILFYVADAPPHNENLQAAFEEAKAARELGIRIYTLAASGVADTAELLIRSMACITQ